MGQWGGGGGWDVGVMGVVGMWGWGGYEDGAVGVAVLWGGGAADPTAEAAGRQSGALGSAPR